MIVLDTHYFLWYVSKHPRLTESREQELFDRRTEVFVPSICFWEMMLLHEKRRISLGTGNPSQVLRRWLEGTSFIEAPLTREIAILSRTLEFTHNDPVDRFVAATAYAMGAELATADAVLRRLPWIRLAF